MGRHSKQEEPHEPRLELLQRWRREMEGRCTGKMVCLTQDRMQSGANLRRILCAWLRDLMLEAMRSLFVLFCFVFQTLNFIPGRF